MVENNPHVQSNNAKEDALQELESRLRKRDPKCSCESQLANPECRVHGFLRRPEIGFVLREFDKPFRGVDHAELVRACRTMLDNIKKRYPNEDRKKWRCPDMQKVSDLIKFS